MVRWLDGGNPSALYEEGRRARAAIDEAREQIASALGCAFADVVFTSGGTEAANLAILGFALANQDSDRKRIILGAAEHHCVLHTAEPLSRLGYQVDHVQVDEEAIVHGNALEEALDPDVLLVSVMHANNELGTLNPISDLARRTHRVGGVFHADAVQTFGRPELPWRVADLGADLVSISAHKVGGPKATGALYVREGIRLRPWIGGGGQEREMRGGTENVAGIVGFAAAVAGQGPPLHPTCRDLLAVGLEALGAVRTVHRSTTLNGHLHVRFPGRDAGTLLIALDRSGISASSGAACSSGSIEASHVLRACGYSEVQAKEGIRFTLSSSTSEEDVVDVVRRIASILSRSGGLA